MFRFQTDKRLSAAALYATDIAEGVTDTKGSLVVNEVAINNLHRPRNITDRALGSLEVDEVQSST
jgi:hypothetical protein